MGMNDIYPTPQDCFKNHHEIILVIYYDRVKKNPRAKDREIDAEIHGNKLT